MDSIPFNKPYMTGKELFHIAEAHFNCHLSGDGNFTGKCSKWLEARTGAHKALLTHSCTAALEMTAILADIKAGDEVRIRNSKHKFLLIVHPGHNYYNILRNKLGWGKLP